eukprot:TRINITY_DN74751_c0_g1_i1.p1 TRINITY_DN74751_c0_g1~~TRINITY_DN74751_c0_g1_i1.p1  ORF type:complete len:434 (-),score=51.52 TRINITY_DN74751_c0_g1_i1:503-1735(-)
MVQICLVTMSWNALTCVMLLFSAALTSALVQGDPDVCSQDDTAACKRETDITKTCASSFWSYVSEHLEHPVADIALLLEAWLHSRAPECAEIAREPAEVFRIAQDALVAGTAPEFVSLLLFKHSAMLAANRTWSSAPRVLEEDVACRKPINVSDGWRKFDDKLLALELEHGRVCEGGWCPARCGLLVLDGAISASEASQLRALGAEVLAKKAEKDGNVSMKPNVDLHDAVQHADKARHLLFMHVLERSRRLIAAYVGVPASWISFASHFLVKKEGTDTSGDSDDDVNTEHCDESSFKRFHFSGVLWLTDHGGGNGGELRFRDADTRTWRNTVKPRVGRLALFSSGWENIHRVQDMKRGTRWALPLFASVVPPFNATRLAKGCVHPSGSKQWNYCQSRLADFLSAPDGDIA